MTRTKKAKKAKKALSPEEQEERLLNRIIAAEEARDDLLAFARFMRPDPADPEDVSRTTWMQARHHEAIAGALQKVEDGRIRKLILTMQPRVGKTTLTSHLLVPWYLGRHPEKSVIVATYNEKFAGDHGRKIRDLMMTSQYRQVFPDVDISKSSAASIQVISTPQGGQCSFVGRGSAITGRGGDLLIADDLIKDRVEADSATFRDDLWEWWNDVFLSRKMDNDFRVVLCMTRWHADDPPGRLIDPGNDFFDRETSKLWHILSLPALAGANDPLGRAPGEPLWPERFSKETLEADRRANPRGFEALYQGNPTPASGNLVQEDWLKSYETDALPDIAQMRVIIGLDLAVSGKSEDRRDSSVMIPAALDASGTLWILPDVVWEKLKADKIVERLVGLVKVRKPLYVSGEKGQIAKSLGPFIHKAMREEGVHASMWEYATTADKVTRFQSMIARLALGKVKFPTRSTWWTDARQQLLQFPSAPHDDFVDALSSISLALDQLFPARGPKAKEKETLRAGTFAALKAELRDKRLRTAARRW